MCPDTQQQSQMHTQCPDVRPSFATDPEDAKVSVIVEFEEFALMDGADAELALDGGDERGTLEECSGECLQRACERSFAARELVVESDDCDVFFAGTLLGLDETGGAVETDDQTAGDFGVKGSAVAGLFNPLVLSAQGFEALFCRGSYLSMRLTHATTSWLEGLEGLSRLMTPELMYDLRSRFKGVQPTGMGVKCPVRTKSLS